ncbi:MAG: RsmD family RNA methyltransferase, partial [Firmicutes bacterium]|nr:RsmD family RNA methyltransferase [Bacillota bacterium]
KNDYTKALDLIKENKILKSDGVVVFEHSGKNDLQSFLDCSTIDTRKFGTTYISFIKNLS